ncbi:MAG: hypothetical protein ACLUHE_08215 [Christensenellales bacterium]
MGVELLKHFADGNHVAHAAVTAALTNLLHFCFEVSSLNLALNC